MFAVLAFVCVGFILAYKPYSKFLTKNVDVNAPNGGFSEVDFSSIAEGFYVDDPVLGRFPGKSELNATSSEYYSYINNRETASKIEDVYKFYTVLRIEDRLIGSVVLYNGSNSATHILNCDKDKTFAHHKVNARFISSGFDLSKTVDIGDRIATKCLDESCKILGPECILIKDK